MIINIIQNSKLSNLTVRCFFIILICRIFEVKNYIDFLKYFILTNPSVDFLYYLSTFYIIYIAFL